MYIFDLSKRKKNIYIVCISLYLMATPSFHRPLRRAAGGRAVCFRSESTRITPCQGAIRHVVQNLFKLVRSICDVV